MPVEFHGDETLLTSHKTLAFSLHHISIFNVMKLYETPLRLTLDRKISAVKARR
jgi:hypothetical protein